MRKHKSVPAFKAEADERNSGKAAAAQKLDETKITEALKWASDEKTLIENDYYDAYSALLDFFNKLDLQNEQKITYRIFRTFRIAGFL